MNLIFFDGIPWDYDVSTPAERPLGGSQSALCYLAVELARRGHRVTLINGVSQSREVQGVRCISVRQMTADVVGQPCDAFVVLNGPGDLGLRARQFLFPGTPLVLWTQHAFDQPAMAALRTPPARDVWDAVVCISQWQRGTFIEQFGLNPARVWILRNAIGPLFEGLFASPEELVRAKPERPVLAYTSTPFRGLNVLAALFPSLRAEFPDLELQVYSSMKVYQQEDQDASYAGLYQQCRTTPGIRYVGSVGQKALAEALRGVSILSYPNTFAETACIAVMEALAAGAYVVSSDLGALPETSMGFATLVPPGPYADLTQFGSVFREYLAAVLRRWRQDPAGFAAGRFAQVQQINASCTWKVRAREWEETILGWQRQQQRHVVVR